MGGRLSFRVGAAIGLTCALLLVIGGVAAWYVHRLEKFVSNRLAEDLPKVRTADELMASARDLQVELTRYLATGERKYLTNVPAIFNSLDAWLTRATPEADGEDEAPLVAEIRRGMDSFQSQFAKIQQRQAGAEVREGIGSLNDREVPNEILRPAREYLDRKSQSITRVSEQNQQTADRVALVLLLLGVCGCVAGLLAGFAITRRMHRAMVKLQIPVLDATGKLAEVIGPIDVSSTVEIEHLDVVLHDMAARIGTVVDRLHASQRELLRNEQVSAIGQLAAGMAHELRNPLTTMKILVQSALEQGPAGNLNGRDLEVLQEEIIRQEHSLTAFVNFARPPKPHIRIFDAGEALSQTLNAARPQAERQGIELRARLANERLLINGDREQIRQVCVNLILNAFDALPNGGTVTIDASGHTIRSPLANVPPAEGQEQDSLGWLHICIADDGPGIPPELGDRIFEPFVSTKETGSGLGLSICRQTISAHGGQITGANNPQGGAEFTIRLPLAAAPVPKDAAETDSLLSAHSTHQEHAR